MLHLLPIRHFLGFVAALVAAAGLAAVYAGWIGAGDALTDAVAVIRWSSSLATATALLFFAAWRWCIPMQMLIFPYLGGQWSGTLAFRTDGEKDFRKVQLMVNHSLIGIKFLLESDESTSKTLVVHAERDRNFERYRIYYIYLNERKEGVEGAGDRYRGLAILRVECGPQYELHGDYFTERYRRGAIHLVRDAAHPWWKIWC